MLKNLSKKKKIILMLILIAVIIGGVVLIWLIASGKLKSSALTRWALIGDVSTGSDTDCKIGALVAYLRPVSGSDYRNTPVNETGDYAGTFSFSQLYGSYKVTVSGECPQISSPNPLGFCSAGGEYDVSGSNPDISLNIQPASGRVTISVVRKVSCSTLRYRARSGCVAGEKTVPVYGVTIRWTNSDSKSGTFTSNYTNQGVKQLLPQPVGNFTIEVIDAPTGYNQPTIHPSVQGCQMNTFPVILENS
jgi:hypothetical protein